MKVSAAIAGPVPEIAAGCATAQAGVPVPPAGLEVTAQLRATLPVNPLLGVTVIVEVAASPCVIGAGEVPLSENVPGVVAAWMTYAALSTMLVPTEGLMATA